jgi:hypothetical protein
MTVRDIDQAGRISRHDHRVLGESDTGATEALGLDAITMVEIAIGRESGGGGEQEDEREAVSHVQQLVSIYITSLVMM